MPTGSNIKLAYRGIPYFEDLIEKEVPFSFPRYGDGEFSSILGYSGKNCDGVQYTEKLRNSLIKTLISPHLEDMYFYGMLAVALRFHRPYIEKFISINNLSMTWTEATFLVAANRHGKFSRFLDILRKRPILYVGPKYLRKLPDVLGLKIDYFIEIPEKTAFASREKIRKEVLSRAGKADFIGFSAGPSSKWLIWSLFPDIGDKYTLFDFGSIFDAYVGRPSRKYQKRKTWAKIAEANLA
jgi:hypothetical protein